MSDSDSSSGLSEAPEEEVQKLAPIFLTAKKATKKACPPPPVSPPRPKRPASPPHEEVFADNPDIAVSYYRLCDPVGAKKRALDAFQRGQG